MSTKCCVGRGRASPLSPGGCLHSFSSLSLLLCKVTGGSSLTCPAPVAPREAALRRGRCSFASIRGWSSSRRGAGGEGLFPPSAGFLRFPARFLRFASCFLLFRFLSLALLGLVFFFCLLLVLFLFLHVSLLSGSRTSAIAATPGANQTPLSPLVAIFSPQRQGKVVSRNVRLM